MIHDEHTTSLAVCVLLVRPINLALGKLGVGYAIGRFEVVVEFVEEIRDCCFVGSIVYRLLASVGQIYRATTHQ